MNELRDMFVRELSETQQKAYKLLFKKMDEYYKETKKSFEEFNKEDFEVFIKKYLIGKSANSTIVKVSLCKKYAEYLNKDFVQVSRIEIAKMVEDSLKEKEIENEQQLRYVSWNDLKVGLNRVSNAIDVAVICLLRMGIGHNKFKELAELKVENIDIDNKVIHLEDRDVEIKDDYVLQVLKEAIEQRTYTVMLSYDKNEPRVSEYDFNMNCPYLIKQKPWNKNNNGLDCYKFSGITGKIFRIMSNELQMDISAINLLQSNATDELLVYEQNIGREISIREAKEYLRHIKNSCGSYDITKIAKYVKENKINN